jgi:hypothetical protein
MRRIGGEVRENLKQDVRLASKPVPVGCGLPPAATCDRALIIPAFGLERGKLSSAQDPGP